MQIAENMHEFVPYRIDQHVRKRSQNEFARPLRSSRAADERMFLERLRFVIETLNRWSGKGLVVLMEIIADLFKIAGRCKRPSKAPQGRNIRAMRASISGSSSNSPRAI